MLTPLSLPRRYLVGFDPKELPHHFTDVLVIGGGVAGLRTALGLQASHRVLVVTKDEVRESNSHYAQGGIAGVLDPEDRFDDHIADTLAAGKGLCDPDVVAMVVHEAPRRINELMTWGTHFDTVNGQVALTREGGHSHARIVHALGDATGREVMRAVILQARARRNTRIWQNSFTIDLLTHEGRCRGALVWDRRRGPALVWSRAVLLATGGAGQLFRETTNPPIATGDGHAVAYRAGAELRDMGFMQFHPTVLYIAGSARHLLTEALRGEGAYLRDRNGHRFMPDYHPLAEPAPRDEGSPRLEVPPIAGSAAADGQEPLDLADIRDSLRALMWRAVGISRDAAGLAEAAEQVDFWCRYVLGHVFADPAGWTMQNMLIVA